MSAFPAHFPASPFRRRLLGAAVALPVLPVLPSSARAQFRVEIGGVGATQLPIAVARFKGEDAAPQNLSFIVMADLERSGLFRRIEAPGVIDEVAAPSMGDWRSRGADALVGGSATRLADGRFDVRHRLWDVVKGADLGGSNTVVPAADLRLAAHQIADAVYERLTGEKGVFSTRIMYVTRSSGRYQLRIADADGEGGQVALNSPEPIISPAWAPNGKEVAYVSFESQKAVVWAQVVATGARRMVANFKGSNSAPAWSPDSNQLAVTLTRDGVSQLYLLSREGSIVKRLTNSTSIDTEPVFSPDGRKVYFVSDRGGSPQVYRVDVDSGATDRVTFSGSFNLSPAISPDGRLLAYITRQGGAYRLMVQPLEGGAATALTDTSDDQSPSFSPNGRLIIYATKVAGREVLMTTTTDGKIKARLASSGAVDIREPAWGPFGR